jgi:hypothetical protein
MAATDRLGRGLPRPNFLFVRADGNDPEFLEPAGRPVVR